MPIRINLLAEAQAAEEARRRDPVKRAIWVAGLLILLMLLWGGFELSKTMVARNSLQDKEKLWKTMEANVKSVAEQEKTSLAIAKQIDALNRLSTNRFLWGSVLNALQQAQVDQVQFIRVTGNQSYQQVDTRPVPAQGKKPAIPASSSSTESIVLVIEAKDYGNLTDQNYMKLQNALINVPFFKTNVGPNNIALDALVTQPTPDEKGRLFTTFILKCKFPEKKREEDK